MHADEELVRLLHERHGAALWAVALRSTSDPGRAQDAVQETLFRAWRHPEAVGEERGDARPWLLRTLRNVLIDDWRARSVRPEVLTEPSTGLDGPPHPVVGDHADAAVQSWVVSEALGRLSAQHRAVLVECFYRGHTVSEAARRLGVPPGTVKSRSHYALRALRLALEEMGVSG